ncbi:MAG TPA: hypothetical protein VKV16_07825 [Solirubrobacteraceae bacterium]|nr:hypothetical protein [Solirubrobacteraceae bacterium]
MRPTKPLPTDRMKQATQAHALRSIAVASSTREKGVSAADIAPRIGVAEATAGLSNAFFAEAGWIERSGKGLYKPTDATLKYAQRFGFNETEAASFLAPSIARSWYFREIEPELRMGRPVPVAGLVSILAQAASAGAEYRSQLEGVLDWLEYVGLLLITDGHVQLGERDLQDRQGTGSADGGGDDGSGEGSEPAEDRKGPADAEGKKPTKRQDGGQPALLSLSFDFALTAEDLAKLKPEQITALFEAVGKVAAIKASLT